MTYDLAIIGSGAGGYTAALYAVRYKMKTIVIGNQEGGQSALAHDIENYPGFESIKGPELMAKFKKHAEKFGAEMKMDEVSEIIKNDDGKFSLPLAYSGETIDAKTVILAVGTKNRKLGAKGEDEFYGKGVTYCATCDGFFFKEKIVGLVGGGDSAATAALYLADICPKVYLIVRKDKMRAEPIWVEQLEARDNIEILYNTEVAEFAGDTKLEKIITKDGREIKMSGCFIEIGANPNTGLVKNLDADLDQNGYIVVDKAQNIPSVKGLMAVGDVTTNSNHFHQIATAVGEGALAANTAFEIVSRG